MGVNTLATVSTKCKAGGIRPSAVDDAITSNPAVKDADNSVVHYGPTNDISVVLNPAGSVRTVGHGSFRPR